MLRSHQVPAEASQHPKLQWAQQPEMCSPTSFTFFEQLPIELRQAIWCMSLAPRTVEVQVEFDRFFTQAPLPAALVVCPDSRTAVNDLYPSSFFSVGMKSTIRFNFSLDTLYLARVRTSYGETGFPVLHFFDVFTPKEACVIQYIAMEYCLEWDGMDVSDLERFWVYMKKGFDCFTSLKKLLVVCEVQDALAGFIELWEGEAEARDNCCEFSEDYPKELICRALALTEQLSFDEVLDMVEISEETHPDANFLRKEEWDVGSGIQPTWVWGWRKAPYPAFY